MIALAVAALTIYRGHIAVDPTCMVAGYRRTTNSLCLDGCKDSSHVHNAAVALTGRLGWQMNKSQHARRHGLGHAARTLDSAACATLR